MFEGVDKNDYLLRYASNINLANIDLHGQERIAESRVSIIGCGALGSTVAKMLCANGVGQVALWDDDEVELSDLARQTSFREKDVGQAKVVALSELLSEQNANTRIRHYRERLNKESFQSYKDDFANQHLILDCTDSWKSRSVISELSIQNGWSWLHASVIGYQGQVALFKGGDGYACYSCLFPQPIELTRCSVVGVSNSVVAIIAGLQVMECLRFLLDPLNHQSQFIFFDAIDYQLHKFKLHKNPDCPSC